MCRQAALASVLSARVAASQPRARGGTALQRLFALSAQSMYSWVGDEASGRWATWLRRAAVPPQVGKVGGQHHACDQPPSLGALDC